MTEHINEQCVKKKIVRFWVSGNHDTLGRYDRRFKMKAAALAHAKLLNELGYRDVGVWRNWKVFETERLV